jgi:hypothetical protein
LADVRSNAVRPGSSIYLSRADGDFLVPAVRQNTNEQAKTTVMNCPNCRQPLMFCNCHDAAEQIERFLAGAKGKIANPLYNDLVYRAADLIEKRIGQFGGQIRKVKKPSGKSVG